MVVGAGWVVLYDVKGKRTVSKVDLSGSVGTMSRCLFRESLVLLPEGGSRCTAVPPRPRRSRMRDVVVRGQARRHLDHVQQSMIVYTGHR